MAGYEQFVEQKITQQTTILAGATGVVSVTVPSNGKALLKGYGYTWFASHTYQLRAGTFVLPSRTDQEGSTSIPVIYGNPFPANSGETISLTITNSSAADHTYDVVFYVITNRIIPTNSTGGELVLATGGGGGVAGSVAIFDSTFSTSAGVTAKGLQVQDNAPVTLTCASASITSATAAAIASTVALKKGVLVEADSANTDYVAVGNATNQTIKLYAGDSVFIEIDDIAKVYAKKNVTNVTINYFAS
jgi:hypothetical protein